LIISVHRICGSTGNSHSKRCAVIVLLVGRRMEQKRPHEKRSYEDFEYQLSHHLQSVAHKTVQEYESRWSDDDTGSGIENDDDDNSDNTWLVSASISSTSSEHSVDSDDDENDLESIPSEPETCSNTRHCDKLADISHGQQEYHSPVSDLASYINHRYDTKSPDSIQQIHKPPGNFFKDTKNRIHSYLSFYSEFITKAKHQEILLKLLQWSLWLVGACIVPSSTSNGLLPQWIQKLSYDICYARYVTRLLGLPVAIEGAMSGSWATSCSVRKNPSLDATYRFIGLVLAYSMVAYYPAEHVAFFLWMNPNAESVLNLSAATWFYVSMRCWLVYLVAEMIQCVLKYNELQHHQRAMQQVKKTDMNEKTKYINNNDANIQKKPSLSQQMLRFINRIVTTHTVAAIPHDNEHYMYGNKYNSEQNNDENDVTDYDVTPMELNDEMYNVMLLFVRNLFYIAPCMNWSMSTWDTDPLLSDMALNGLMWMEAVICLYQAIYNAS
jgi:Peroxisomal biogenesis factor 11 (PEX11)